MSCLRVLLELWLPLYSSVRDNWRKEANC